MYSIWRTSFNFSCTKGLLASCLSPRSSWSPPSCFCTAGTSFWFLLPAFLISTWWRLTDKFMSKCGHCLECPDFLALSDGHRSPYLSCTNSLKCQLISYAFVGRPSLSPMFCQRWSTLHVPRRGACHSLEFTLCGFLTLRLSKELKESCNFVHLLSFVHW